MRRKYTLPVDSPNRTPPRDRRTNQDHTHTKNDHFIHHNNMNRGQVGGQSTDHAPHAAPSWPTNAHDGRASPPMSSSPAHPSASRVHSPNLPSGIHTTDHTHSQAQEGIMKNRRAPPSANTSPNPKTKTTITTTQSGSPPTRRRGKGGAVSPASPMDRAKMSDPAYVQRRLLNEALMTDTSSNSSLLSDADSVTSSSNRFSPTPEDDKADAEDQAAKASDSPTTQFAAAAAAAQPPVSKQQSQQQQQQQPPQVTEPRLQRMSSAKGAGAAGSVKKRLSGVGSSNISLELGEGPPSIMRRRGSKEVRVPSPGRRNRAPLVNIMPPTSTTKAAHAPPTKRSILKK